MSIANNPPGPQKPGQPTPERQPNPLLYRCYRVYLHGKPFAYMTTAPCDESEALEHARFHWPQATVAPHI